MKLIPVFKCSNLIEAIKFYTEKLDFTVEEYTPEDPLVHIYNEDSIIQLTTGESDKLYGSVIYVPVTDVDAHYEKYKGRGLDTTKYPQSPVHTSPVDQTWGWREFYVTDQDGNTLRFCTKLKQ